METGIKSFSEIKLSPESSNRLNQALDDFRKSGDASSESEIKSDEKKTIPQTEDKSKKGDESKKETTETKDNGDFDLSKFKPDEVKSWKEAFENKSKWSKENTENAQKLSAERKSFESESEKVTERVTDLEKKLQKYSDLEAEHLIKDELEKIKVKKEELLKEQESLLDDDPEDKKRIRAIDREIIEIESQAKNLLKESKDKLSKQKETFEAKDREKTLNDLRHLVSEFPKDYSVEKLTAGDESEIKKIEELTKFCLENGISNLRIGHIFRNSDTIIKEKESKIADLEKYLKIAKDKGKEEAYAEMKKRGERFTGEYLDRGGEKDEKETTPRSYAEAGKKYLEDSGDRLSKAMAESLK